MTVATAPVKKEHSPDVVEAWRAYRDALPRPGSAEYEKVEPFAWMRLKERLRTLGVKLSGEPRR